MLFLLLYNYSVNMSRFFVITFIKTTPYFIRSAKEINRPTFQIKAVYFIKLVWEQPSIGMLFLLLYNYSVNMSRFFVITFIKTTPYFIRSAYVDIKRQMLYNVIRAYLKR